MVSFGTLPLEVLDLTVLYISDSSLRSVSLFSDQQPPGEALACYATLSRKWQAAVEQYTFATVKTSSSHLTRLKKDVGSCSRPRRRNTPRTLFYQTELPAYNLNRKSLLRVPTGHQANLVAFRVGARKLWEELSLWN
ncbi:hypothetical protein BJY04DRAFT_213939 [Aspergillus karnatakaensis]|uniref:uncharacterized protein n=1 Tax=Aspergillus karnatakaensis TaxID=1810916 RepID=UPI003CCD0FBC